MSYKNIYYDRKTSTVHLWDSKRGYSPFKYRPYGYVVDEFGEYESIYGDKLSKIPFPKKDEPNSFETDVTPTTRTLVDLYTDSDEPSENVTVFVYDIEVEMETGLPNTLEGLNEITSIAGYDNQSKDFFVYILDKENKITESRRNNVHIKPFDNERNLLEAFLNKWEEVSPDIVSGWNIDFFDNPYLYNRLRVVLGEAQANRLSPIGIVYYHKARNVYQIAGVSSLDYMMLYKKFTYNELDNYRLDTVGKMEIDKGKIEYNGSLDDLFKNDIEKFIEYNLVDVDIVVGLDEKLQFIDLARGICHIGHVPYEDIVFSSRYLEGAVLTYLKRKRLVAPNRIFSKFEEDTVNFSGAYVKPPIPGKYDWIYDLDLTSLYPSIIMTLNISPETKVAVIENFDSIKYVRGEDNGYTLEGREITAKEIKELVQKFNFSISSNGVLYDLGKEGCIPDILNTWFDKRVEYRKLEAEYGHSGDTEKYKFYKQRQLIQKILLNSLYGVLGLQNWRWFDLDNAEAVTRTGVDVIKTTANALNAKYNKELGGIPYLLDIEDGSTIELYPNSLAMIKRDGIALTVKGSELKEGDDFIQKIGNFN